MILPRWCPWLFVGVLLYGCTKPAYKGPPDIVIVSFDTTRADRLGAYGYFRDTSPTFDKLARESVVFDNYLVPMATTLPSHTSVFTGVFPPEHGIEANIIGKRRFHSPERLRYLAEYLKGAGYVTGAVVSAAPLHSGTGMERGFDFYSQSHGGDSRRANETTDYALIWLRDMSKLPTRKPIFLFVHYFDAHTPFEPPAPFDTRFTDEPRLKRYLNRRGFLVGGDGRKFKRKALFERANAYDGELAYLDSHFQRLVQRLQRRKRWAKDTVLIVLGDHGESLGQHGQIGHGRVWREQLRAPLLMRIPGVEARRVGALTSPVDVVPTLLAHLKLSDKSQILDQVSGQDVLAKPRVAPLLSAASLQRLTKGESRTWAVHQGRYSYQWAENGAVYLFNDEADPHEKVNLAAEQPDLVAKMHQDLLRLRQEQRARGEAFGAGEMEGVSYDAIEALKALGYLGGAGDGVAE